MNKPLFQLKYNAANPRRFDEHSLVSLYNYRGSARVPLQEVSVRNRLSFVDCNVGFVCRYQVVVNLSKNSNVKERQLPWMSLVCCLGCPSLWTFIYLVRKLSLRNSNKFEHVVCLRYQMKLHNSL